jgi:RNA polymerase sigma factor (TIGR02999 family)
MSDVTRILCAIDAGDPSAAEELLPLVYAELRRLAAQKLANEKPGQTLDATGLVHEAYLRLVPSDPTAASDKRHWDGRAHFFGAAAEAMRRILVENARRKGRTRHGGGMSRIDFDMASCETAAAPSVDLLALDEALTRLAAEAPAKAEVVKLRFFAGLTMPEIAAALGVSLTTAERHWTYARTWLYAELDDRDPARAGQQNSRPT